jgi:hypothetical protein
MIHAAGQSGTVVDEVELASQTDRVGGAHLGRQIGEHLAHPRSEVVSGLFDQPARRCFGGGRDERAPVEIGLLVLLCLGIEDGQDLLPRIVGGLDR